jgi:hypothetical protein
MKVDGDAWITLLASLPAHSSLLAARHTPISRLRLEKRLNMLSAPERLLVDEVESLLQWRALPMSTDNNQLVQRQRRLLDRLSGKAGVDGHAGLPGGLDLVRVFDLVMDRLDVRTLVAALWSREYGSGKAPEGNWSVSRYRPMIEHNWQDPCFRLERAQPWLPEILPFIHQRQPLALEKHLLQHGWRNLGRYEQPGDFSLLAVIVYVLKWDMVDRWTRYDAGLATRRFRSLCEQGLSSLHASEGVVS